MTAYEALGAALISAMIAPLLYECGFRGTKLISAFTMALLFIGALTGLETVFAEIKALASLAGALDTVKSALKILGVGYIFAFCADICLSLGESGVSNAIEVVGRVEILTICTPYLTDIVGQVLRAFG